jgi:hypothetical protein
MLDNIYFVKIPSNCGSSKFSYARSRVFVNGIQFKYTVQNSVSLRLIKILDSLLHQQKSAEKEMSAAQLQALVLPDASMPHHKEQTATPLMGGCFYTAISSKNVPS